MQIIMIETANGCDDGINACTYEVGETYNVSDSLAKCFLDLKVAEISEDAKEEKADQPPSNKALTEEDYQKKAQRPSRTKRG